MAEGWARHLKAGRIEACSAGTQPKGIHPKAIEVMKEAGVDLSAQRSAHIREFEGRPIDWVITLCGSAHENCPVFPGETRVVHHGFDDPGSAEGGEEEVLNVFRRVRDEIRRFVEGLPESL
jgi:arsenate reductase